MLVSPMAGDIGERCLVVALLVRQYKHMKLCRRFRLSTENQFKGPVKSDVDDGYRHELGSLTLIRPDTNLTTSGNLFISTSK